MKKVYVLLIILFPIFINSSFAQQAIHLQDAKIIEEIAPKEFQDYKGSLLVMPAFRRRGIKKWLTKQFDKNYGKPFHVADATEIITGYGDDKYPIDTYKYMVFIQSSKNFSGNTIYKFQLVDRSTNTIYYDTSPSDMLLRKYIRKILK